MPTIRPDISKGIQRTLDSEPDPDLVRIFSSLITTFTNDKDKGTSELSTSKEIFARFIVRTYKLIIFMKTSWNVMSFASSVEVDGQKLVDLIGKHIASKYIHYVAYLMNDPEDIAFMEELSRVYSHPSSDFEELMNLLSDNAEHTIRAFHTMNSNPYFNINFIGKILSHIIRNVNSNVTINPNDSRYSHLPDLAEAAFEIDSFMNPLANIHSLFESTVFLMPDEVTGFEDSPLES